MSYYQEGHIEKFGEVVKWKTFSIKTYILSGNWTGLQSKRLNSRTIHQTCLGYQLPKPFTGLVWSPTGLVRWTRPVQPRPASRGIYRTCSVPHQTCPVDQTFSRHRIPKRFTELVQSSDTSMGRFPPETIKGGLHPLYSFGHSSKLQNTPRSKSWALRHSLKPPILILCSWEKIWAILWVSHPIQARALHHLHRWPQLHSLLLGTRSPR
jgi:hypothetical protein